MQCAGLSVVRLLLLLSGKSDSGSPAAVKAGAAAGSSGRRTATLPEKVRYLAHSPTDLLVAVDW